MAVDSGKKRKRDLSVSIIKPKKKRTVQDPPAQAPAPAPTRAPAAAAAKARKSHGAASIRISSVVTPKFSAPVIATTPGLSVPQSVEFDSFIRTDKKSLSSSRAKAQAASQPCVSTEMMLHSAGHHAVDFTGKEEQPATKGAESFLRHYIGVFDPATGQLKVVEAKKMVVRGCVRSREAPEEEMRGVPVKKNMTDMRNELGQTFGTKKAKKAIRSITENAISPTKRTTAGGSADAADSQPAALDAAERAMMASVSAATSTMATSAQLQAAVDEAKPIPVGNFAASVVQEVYRAEDLAETAEVLAAVPVRDWQTAVRAEENLPLFSRFVAQRVHRVVVRAEMSAAGAEETAEEGTEVGETVGLTHLRLLRYLYWTILFWQAAKPGRQRGTKRQPPREKLRAEMDGAPEVIIESLRRRFSDNGTIRKFHADLLMTHCAAMAAVLDNYEVDTFDLRQDLQLDAPQMSQYFHEIGARTKQVKTDDKVSHVAKLALPLRFPTLRRRQQRR